MQHVSHRTRHLVLLPTFFFSSRRRHTRYWRDWSSDVCSSDLSLPSQEGNCRDASAFLFPSWEGSGMGRILSGPPRETLGSGTARKCAFPSGVGKIGRASCRERV